MAVRHVCPLCDYSREAAHATVLDPVCPTCGSVLAPAGPVPPEASLQVARIARARWFERTILALVLTPILLASIKLGWSAAGVAGGLGALVLASLVSFVALAPSGR